MLIEILTLLGYGVAGAFGAMLAGWIHEKYTHYMDIKLYMEQSAVIMQAYEMDAARVLDRNGGES